ncbi:DUF2127 domain-containing protein [Sphingomonas daechungensis]|uniref:DUF2127 domain-containing protein n=1 Tax=Sphingomonas daechungensis TaxID=1176646 RepID=A0ABX6T3C1_9SPHN|nr:DUF2127 domain-containing protein [Sphingomonas daechungensis]QNP43708.1 DUF2127 domain-containing protein [Sphingomonas daechungensis]
MKERRIHGLFVLTVGLKGFYALVEMASGIALYLVAHDSIINFLSRFITEERLQDPQDWVASTAMKLAHSFSLETQHFYAFYLFTHGLLKLAVVIGLLREKLWAYPACFVVFSAFIVYQLYRYSFTQDVGLLLLSVLDAFVIALAVHEYRLLKKHLPTH